MTIMLGNLSVEQMEKRLGIKFPEECVKFMNETHQSLAEGVKKGQWHCFEMPFEIVVGDMETAQKIFDWLKPFSADCKCQLQFSLIKEA